MLQDAMVDPTAPKQPHSIFIPCESTIALTIKNEMLIMAMLITVRRVNTPNRRLIAQASSMNGSAHPKAIANGPGSISKLYTTATE